MYRYIVFFLIFSLGLSSCGKKQSNQNDPQKKSHETRAVKDSTNHNKGKDDNTLIPVEVAAITQGSISNYILLSSNLETEIQADVYARAQGIVEEIMKEEGNYVEKGEVMLRLDAQDYEISEQQAHVDYEKQLNNFKRLQVMHKKALLSDEEFEDAKYGLKAAELKWDNAKLQLDYRSVRSPISGWVGERNVKVGQRIQPTDKLFSVINSSQVIAVVYVPEKNIGQLKKGQKAIITSDNLGTDQFDGWIKRISPVVDPSSGTFKVTVGVRNRKRALRPGMFVNVHLIIDTHPNAILVPKTAIVYENEFMNIYIVKKGVAHKIRMNPGFEDSEKIEALSGVQPGDKVIVVGQAGMKDKARVRIVSERKIKYVN